MAEEGYPLKLYGQLKAFLAKKGWISAELAEVEGWTNEHAKAFEQYLHLKCGIFNLILPMHHTHLPEVIKNDPHFQEVTAEKSTAAAAPDAAAPSSSIPKVSIPSTPTAETPAPAPPAPPPAPPATPAVPVESVSTAPSTASQTASETPGTPPASN